ncbi:MAG: VWA domain-containing protein [Sulfolobales archaeon]|nr:VWA domain-containing protein [Sulfolobales archaeon]MCX8199543.1 VWA domain-containing protein [Sulfolobales archaeon]MDW8170496.1 VWA domain-containing protein [Desulfurococcaceae archaeon]
MKKLSEKQLRNTLRSSIWRDVSRINKALLKLGIRIPVSQAVALVEIAETYAALKGVSKLSLSDLLDVASSVYTLIDWSNELRSRVLELSTSRGKAYVYTKLMHVEDMLSTIGFNNRVNLKHLLRGEVRERVEAYILLRKAGVIRRARGGELRTCSAAEYRESYSRLSKIDVTPRDIVKYISEVPGEVWNSVVSDNDLVKLSMRDLIKLAKLSSSRSSSLSERVVNEIVRRVSDAASLKACERRRLINIVRSRVKKDPRLLLKLTGEVRKDSLQIEGGQLLKELQAMHLERRQRVLPNLLKKGLLNVEEAISGLDVLSFTNAGSVDDKAVRSLANLANALVNYVNYLVTLDRGYLDYSSFFMDRVSLDDLPIQFKPLYESLVRQDPKLFMSKLRELDKYAAVEYIAWRAGDLRSSYGDELIKRALQLGLRMLQAFSPPTLCVKTLRHRVARHAVRGEVDPRATLYNFVRMNYAIKYRLHTRVGESIAVIDVSGSMFTHALWTVMSLATLIPRVEYVVFFSSKSSIVRVSGITRWIAYKFLKKVLEEGFGGYTDLESGLRTALRNLRGRALIVVVSDLKQTLPGNPIAAFMRAIDRGNDVIVIVPENHDRDVAEAIKALGVKVIEVHSPLEIPSIIKSKARFKR